MTLYDQQRLRLSEGSHSFDSARLHHNRPSRELFILHHLVSAGVLVSRDRAPLLLRFEVIKPSDGNSKSLRLPYFDAQLSLYILYNSVIA
jgi:hypothetical protein